MSSSNPLYHEKITLYLIRGRAAQATLTDHQHNLRHAVREMYRSREECSEDGDGHECFEDKMDRMYHELRELVEVGRMLEGALMVLRRAEEMGRGGSEGVDPMGDREMEMKKAEERKGKEQRERIVYADDEGTRREEWVERKKGSEDWAEAERAFGVIEKVVCELERGFGNGREMKL